jgi:predicted ATPase
MIQTWTLQNFKSVYDKTTLSIAPLTVFAGANSSGKSTLIQSLLLTAQTLQSPVVSRSVVLNGHIIRLGQYDDIVSNGHEGECITIGFQLKPAVGGLHNWYPRRYYAYGLRDSSINTVNCQFSFSTSDSSREKEFLQLQPRLEESSLVVRISNQKVQEEEVIIRRSKTSIEDRLKQLHLDVSTISQLEAASLEYEVVKSGHIKQRMRRLYGSPYTGRAEGAVLRHFLPDQIGVVFDVGEEQAARLSQGLLAGDREIDSELNPIMEGHAGAVITSILTEVVQATSPKNERVSVVFDLVKKQLNTKSLTALFAVLPSNQRAFLAQRFAERMDEITHAVKEKRKQEFKLAFGPASEMAEAGSEYVNYFFNRSLKYLGPLRDEPKPVYPLIGATDPKDIGFRGEHTAAVLEANRHSMIEYISSATFATKGAPRTPKSASLQHAVLDWLAYMGVASDVKTIDKGKLGHELKISTPDSEELHDLTHVGVGVSQVLPILILSLLAEPGATLIFEQPELHLHPRVQTRLADFFVSQILMKKQCIVETHSEFLINRLRYQTAVSKGGELSENIILYFVEKSKGSSSYRPIRINEFGVIENWPEGFFDENEKNAAAMLEQAMERRSRGKKLE